MDRPGGTVLVSRMVVGGYAAARHEDHAKTAQHILCPVGCCCFCRPCSCGAAATSYWTWSLPRTAAFSGFGILTADGSVSGFSTSHRTTATAMPGHGTAI